MNNINNLFFEGQCKREQSQARLSSAECSLNSIFYQLIQVAIGTRICLSHTPSADEWGELYAMAKKQSLVGVCFAGVQKLQDQQQAPTSTGSAQAEMLYLTWMGMAAKIQQRNEEVNKACDEICERVRADGFECCVLKGQSNLEFYPEGLKGLRTPGDIDLWVWKSAEGGCHKVAEVIRYAMRLNPDTHTYYHHADIEKVRDIEVELHYRPSWMSAPWRNKYLQRWAQEHTPKNGEAASVEFNAVYQLVHIYRHLFSEGIGMRQLLDYWTLITSLKGRNVKCSDAAKAIQQLGMMNFAKSVMWIMQEVFGMSNECMICEPDEERGGFLLKEIMLAGNFGHYDSRIYATKADGSLRWGWMKLKRNMRFLSQYPEEVIFEPLFRVYHFLWRSLKLWKYE